MKNLFATLLFIPFSTLIMLANPPGIKKYQTLDELQNYELNQFSTPKALETLQNQVYLDLGKMDICWKLLEGFNDEIILEIVKKGEKIESHIIREFETTQDGATIYLYDSHNDTWYWFSNKYKNMEKDIKNQQKIG